MSTLRLHTPRGTSDFLPAAAESLRRVEQGVRGLFSRFGYREVITPTFELYDTLAAGASIEELERLFRFFDREGEILVLRSDVTTPIARLVATRLAGSPRPLRLFYTAPVFRWAEDGAGRQREFFQAGVELIGAAEAAADAEVVWLAAQALEEAGVQEFCLDLGQVNFFNAVLAESGLSPAEEAAVRVDFLRKDWVGLQETLATARPAGREAILALTGLRGGPEVLSEARRLPSGLDGSRALDNLTAILDILDGFGVAHRIRFDLGLVKDLTYYTGMVLEGYAPRLGYTICTGGRYDQLHGQFGADAPATGFALGLTRVLAALRDQNAFVEERNPGVLLVAGNDQRGVAMTLARRLADAGVTAEWEISSRDEASRLAYARSVGLVAVVDFLAGSPGVAGVTGVVSGSRQDVSVDQVPVTIASLPRG